MKEKIVIQRQHAELFFDRLGHPMYCYEAVIVDSDNGPELIGNPNDPVNRFKTIVPTEKLGHHILQSLADETLDLGDSVLIKLNEERPGKWNHQFSLLTPAYNGIIISFVDRSTLKRCFDATVLTFE